MFETFHFQPAYEVEVDPEFPGTGEWGVPFFGFGRDGGLVEQFESRWGAPLTVRVTVPSDGGWVAAFAAGGLGGITGVFACPSPLDMCVLADGAAYLIHTRSPEDGAVIVHDQVGQVIPVDGVDLLLVVRFIDIVALGSGGIAWRTERLAIDGLRVEVASPSGISCSRSMETVGGGQETIMIDPADGRVIVGSRLGAPWNEPT